MARRMTFKIGKAEYSVLPAKVDRRKLYGWTELMAVDDGGAPCRLLSADESGQFIIPLGGTGIGILSDTGRWVERPELQTVDADGNPSKVFRSSFDTANLLKEKRTPEQFLEYSISDFYQLTEAPPELMKAVGDDIYSFEYTYNDSYDPSPAFVMRADDVLFLLIGVRNAYEWLCFGDCESVEDQHDDRLIEEGGEDIDFSMF